MSESRPTPTPPATGGDGTGVNSGLRHALVRWSLAHRKLVTTLAVLGFVAFCGWQAWAAYQQVHAWTIKNGNGAVPGNRVDWPFTILLAGMVVWFFLWNVIVRGKRGYLKWTGWAVRSFDARVRERILRGVPIPNGVLLAYALFGVAGLGLGIALLGQGISQLLWIAFTAATLWTAAVWAPFVAVLEAISAVRLLWEILLQTEWDFFLGAHRAQVVEEFLRDEAARQEEERAEDLEEKRTSVGVWSWAVLVVGLGGGMFFSSRLPESEQNLCIGSGLAGLVAAGLAVHLAGTKPRGYAVWLALVALFFAVALVYHWHAFNSPTVRSLLLGVTGGITVGAMLTVLYLRKIGRGAQPNVPARKRIL